MQFKPLVFLLGCQRLQLMTINHVDILLSVIVWDYSDITYLIVIVFLRRSDIFNWSRHMYQGNRNEQIP
jgi:hypothetical protein